MTAFDLRTVRVRSGEEVRDLRAVEVEPFELGGERYLPVPERPEAWLTIARLSSGLLFRLELETRLLGPCMRCLEETAVPVRVDAREYQATSPGESDELRTPYLVDHRLDLSGWARDAIALALPDKILCRVDCAGLCAVCGLNLNREPHEHEEQEVDPRWAKLEELRDRL